MAKINDSSYDYEGINPYKMTTLYIKYTAENISKMFYRLLLSCDTHEIDKMKEIFDSKDRDNIVRYILKKK